jgi:hypothetical protein
MARWNMSEPRCIAPNVRNPRGRGKRIRISDFWDVAPIDGAPDHRSREDTDGNAIDHRKGKAERLHFRLGAVAHRQRSTYAIKAIVEATVFGALGITKG